ncbi:unnamed protein product [Protopolystoma xenopodis]|uniref:Uncharacterized protein n=1 Tax=Protopolystoma xenopodis TaxID=117903 RepID=A0A448WGH9_9PLAT|nr:unnamed protein product [Protopolystoma xenopodis]
MRKESNCRSPLYSHFSSSISGLVVIRGLQDAVWFRWTAARRLSQLVRAELAGSAAAAWLNIRLQAIGLVTLAGVVIISVVGRHFSWIQDIGGLLNLMYFLSMKPLYVTFHLILRPLCAMFSATYDLFVSIFLLSLSPCWLPQPPCAGNVDLSMLYLSAILFFQDLSKSPSYPILSVSYLPGSGILLNHCHPICPTQGAIPYTLSQAFDSTYTLASANRPPKSESSSWMVRPT